MPSASSASAEMAASSSSDGRVVPSADVVGVGSDAAGSKEGGGVGSCVSGGWSISLPATKKLRRLTHTNRPLYAPLP